MTYSIEILRSAQKELGKIGLRDRERIINAIRLLAIDPRPPSCRKLSGRPAWRIRVGSYRVIYEVDDGRIVVTVIAIGHRREVYR